MSAYDNWDYRKLEHSYEIRYSDDNGVYVGTCLSNILTDIIKNLLDEGKRIEAVNIKWM